MELDRKEFHFDLDNRLLRQSYPSSRPTAWNAAWSQIRRIMESNGFMHPQYSGYESQGKMTYQSAFLVIDTLVSECPWFASCARAATFTEIGESYDVVTHLAGMGQEVPDMAIATDSVTRKEFHFDLRVSDLRRYYPSSRRNGWKEAWNDVMRIMESNDFVHSQYSGYESRNQMGIGQAFQVIDQLAERLPWFPKSVRAASITEIGERHDVLGYVVAQQGRDLPAPVPHRSHEQGYDLDSEARDAILASEQLEIEETMGERTQERSDTRGEER